MNKILLIEDDEMLAEIYQTRLQQAGFDCKIANNGLSGVALAQTYTPDLVLLDLMLPEISGDEVLKTMRQSDWGKDIKVLVLTNISEAEAPDGIRELGIEGYIVKANLANDQLVEAVKKALGPVAPKPESIEEAA
jgi:DNA-binding response OmpR family regulator